MVILKRRAGKTGKETKIPYVLSFTFDICSSYMAYDIADPEGKENGLYYVGLNSEGITQKSIARGENSYYAGLSWTKKGSKPTLSL